MLLLLYKIKQNYLNYNFIKAFLYVYFLFKNLMNLLFIFINQIKAC